MFVYSKGRRMDLYQVNIALLVLLLWCIPWWVYNRFIRSKKYHPMGEVIFRVPHWVSCGIPYVSHNPKKNKCENVQFDGWSLGHLLIYITLGMVIPGYWKEVLALSIVCEAFEYAAGWRARWILDPGVNLIGYLVGQLAVVDFSGATWLSSTNTTGALLMGMIGVLWLNRPSMMPRGMDFY